ncbi:MAG: 4-hydroxythreonine-4-phosphate dehydrogenase PdxA [Chloroflexi bacterium]|nr:4-hydroxythreonine-4-phosphate dehydrogenase PdxA [Chloroflexota bacterium]
MQSILKEPGALTRPIIGITMGDPSGIGPEIVAKSLNKPEVYGICRPVVLGDLTRMRMTVEGTGLPLRLRVVPDPPSPPAPLPRGEGRKERWVSAPGTVDILQATTDDLADVPYGRVSAAGGKAAVQCVIAAIELAMAGRIHAIATAPLNKEAMQLAGYPYPGHTELLAEKTGTDLYSLMLVAGKLRVLHVTTHVSMRQAIEMIKRDRVLEMIRLADRTCKQLGITAPRVAVAGLNCHAGEHGIFGTEDVEEIVPAIADARSEGIDATGPWPPDTVFWRTNRGDFDIAVAMYHDEGHIAVKMLGLEGGVNTTAGLPIIRTSVDHGTAYGRAGQWRADERSMLEAIRLAAQLARERFGLG